MIITIAPIMIHAMSLVRMALNIPIRINGIVTMLSRKKRSTCKTGLGAKKKVAKNETNQRNQSRKGIKINIFPFLGILGI